MSGTSPGFDLMYYLDRSILAEIQKDLKQLGSLSAISARDFTFVILKWLCLRWNYWKIDDAVVSLICRVFESVDVDSRGVMSWDNFEGYCLRVGRNQFKPTYRQAVTEYVQRIAYAMHVPGRKLHYIGSTQMLYAYDSELSVVTIIGRKGKLIGRFNPTTAIIRLLKLQESGRQTYYFKKQHAAAAVAAKKKALALETEKAQITCMTYIERKRQLVFCTSNGFLSFWDSVVGCLIGFVRTGSPQIGLCLSLQADCLITWPGEVDDVAYRVWDINTRKLRCQATKHESRPLAVIEVPQHRVMVSATMDRRVILWPIHQLKKIQFTNTRNDYLKGNQHAINRLIYAPDNDYLFGSGFDYEIYVWDMASKLLAMCLSGHRSSVVSVSIVYTPYEHAASVDAEGTLKVWNIDRALSNRAELVQTLVLTRDSPSQLVLDASPAASNGTTIAVLADSLYMVDVCNLGSNIERPLPNGLGICEASDSVFVVSNKVLSSGILSKGCRMRRYQFMEPDRVENSSGVTLSLNPETMKLLGSKIPLSGSHEELINSLLNDKTYLKGDKNLISKLNSHEEDVLAGEINERLEIIKADIIDSLVDPTDDMSAVASDPTGKKLFIGTTGGKVFIYDTSSFGLLTQIRAEIPTTKEHGAVVSLTFIPRDELLVVGYSSGSVRLLLGCHRTIEEAEAAISNSAAATAAANKALAAREREDNIKMMERPVSPPSPEAGGVKIRKQSKQFLEKEVSVSTHIDCPLPMGGKPHPHPVLLRRNDAVQEQMILAVAVSREYGLIAVSGDDGSIRLIDYFTFLAVCCYAVPMISDRSIECNHICFLPNLPVLIGGDIEGRITAWTCKPMEPAWVLTWPASYPFSIPRGANLRETSAYVENDPEDHEVLPILGDQSGLDGSGAPITSLVCCYFMDPPTGSHEDSSKKNNTPTRSRFSSVGGSSTSSGNPIFDLTNDYSWTWAVVAGDQTGKIYQFDLSDIVYQIKCLEKEARPNCPTSSLAPYHQRTVVNFRDCLEEKRLRQVDSWISRPIGCKVGSILKITEITGYRGANIAHIKLMNVWSAHQSGIACMTVLQKTTNQFPTDPKNIAGHLVLEPYGVMSCSESGVVRMWSWNGHSMGQLTEDELFSPEEYSKSLLSKGESSGAVLEGSSMMHASSVEFLNKLNTNNFIQPGVLAQMSILVPDSSKNTEKSIISQRESIRGGQGWVYPEWQLVRSQVPSQAPAVVPFANLPPEFAPRLDGLREWVVAYVKEKITFLAVENKIAENVPVAYGTKDMNASTFLETVHSHIEGALLAAGGVMFTNYMAGPLIGSDVLKPAEVSAIQKYEQEQNDWNSILSKKSVGPETSIASDSISLALVKTKDGAPVLKDIEKSIKEQRKLLKVEQLKRQSSQECWDQKVRFPNISSEALLKKQTSTMVHQDHGVLGYFKEKVELSPDEEEVRLRKQAEALFGKNMSPAKVQPASDTSSPKKAFVQTFSPRGEQHEAGLMKVPEDITPRLQIASTINNEDSKQTEDVNMIQLIHRKQSLGIVRDRFGSTDNLLASQIEGKKMSLQEIFLSSIKARTSIEQSARANSFLSVRNDSLEKVQKKDGTSLNAVLIPFASAANNDMHAVERINSYSSELPPPKMWSTFEILDNAVVSPNLDVTPPKPVGTRNKSDDKPHRGDAEEIISEKGIQKSNGKRLLSEVEYSDTDSEESEGNDSESESSDNRGATLQKIPFAATNKDPCYGSIVLNSSKPPLNSVDTSRPATAPTKTRTKLNNVARIDSIINEIDNLKLPSSVRRPRSSAGNKNSRVASPIASFSPRKNDDISSENGSNNEILFFNDRQRVADGAISRSRAQTADSNLSSVGPDSVKQQLLNYEAFSTKTELDLSALNATLNRFERLTNQDLEASEMKRKLEREAREKKMLNMKSLRKSNKLALNQLDDASSTDRSARSESAPAQVSSGKIKGNPYGKLGAGPLYAERGRTRYGPYKAKDVHTFIDFIERLDDSITRLGHDKNDMSDTKSYLISDVLRQQEILRRPKFCREITRLAAKNNSVVTFLDLISVLFPFASQAEWHRMKTLCLARRLLSDCIIALIPPSAEPESRPPTRTTTIQFMGSSDANMQSSKSLKASNTNDLSAPVSSFRGRLKKDLNVDTQIPSSDSPIKNTGGSLGDNAGVPATPSSRPGSSAAGGKVVVKIPQRDSMAAWKLPYEAADDIRRALDLLYEVETGTITGNDIVDIFNWHEKIKNLDAVKAMGRGIARHGLSVQDEFNGQMFIEVLECVLKIEILKPQFNSRRDLVTSGNTYSRVRLLSAMIHSSDLKKAVGTSARHAETKLKSKSRPVSST